MKICAQCGKPIYWDIREVTFISGHIPLRTLGVRLQANWCGTADCFEEITIVQRANGNKPVVKLNLSP